MLKMSAPNSNLFGAHLAQICAPNKPEPLKGNHLAQKRAKSARYFAHKWRSSLFRAGSGERSARAIQLAASFGARFVRLATGHRVAIADNTVTTVLPPMHHKRQVHRVGLGRFGNGHGGWGNEE